MKNLLKEKPTDKLDARLRLSLSFIKGSDLRDKKVLDVGCGFGWFEEYALKKGVKEIAGIEISKEDLETVGQIRDKRLILKVGTALKIPFEDKSFDTVVAWEVIEHIPNDTENKMFKEVSRVLKNNGAFYLSTPHDALLSKYLDPAWWLVRHRHYSIKRLVMYGLNNNYAVQKLFVAGEIWAALSVINMYFSKWVLRRSSLFNSFFEKRVNREYASEGFYNIFIKYEKTSD
jgi:2-polyprenyl-3-methyl-5-hydroxy-6-metoxy-1,4-benzoquinol methylase